MEGVWAGGDITSGGATVISAMGEGKIAAADMNEWLMKDGKWSKG
jgi:glutamate synthase (NADPH/NADH) small chain